MKGGARESDFVTHGRRMKYVRCTICRLSVRSHRLKDHTQKKHKQKLEIKRGRGRGAEKSETILVCLGHNDPPFHRLDAVSETEKKTFIQEHKDHVKENYKLKKRDYIRLDDIFERTFGPVDPEAREFDERGEVVPFPPPLKSTTSSRLFDKPISSRPRGRSRLDHHEVDLDAADEVIDLVDDSDDDDVMVRATDDVATPEEEESVVMTPNIQQRLESGLPAMDMSMMERMLDSIPSELADLDPDDLEAYVGPFNLQIRANESNVAVPMSSTQVQTGSLTNRAIAQVGEPSHKASIQASEPMHRASVQVSEPTQQTSVQVGASMNVRQYKQDYPLVVCSLMLTHRHPPLEHK